MARILCLGSALQDIYLLDRDDFVGSPIGDQSIFGQIVIGTKVDIDKVSYEVGGGGINSAITFARSGHEVILMSNIAHDSAGEAILKALDKEGIDNSYIGYVGRKNTGTSVILLDAASGERTILTHRGASAKYDNFDENDLDLIKPDWLYVTTLRGDMDTLLRFFEKAHARGTKIMFNPGAKELEQPKKVLGLLEDVDILILNKKEAAKLVPGVLLSELLEHLKGYCKTVIITDGAMGGIATDGKSTYRFGVYEDVNVKDTTGAGDAFGSAFLSVTAKGAKTEEAIIFAAANSASVVQKLGANTGIISDDIELHPMPLQKI